MIRGVVTASRQPVVRLTLRGPSGVSFSFDAVVDTGFAWSLSLPGAELGMLGLPFAATIRTTLADGLVGSFAAFKADVLWDGVWRPINVAAMGTTPLVGMGLLDGHELRVACVPGGAVEIAPLPPGPAPAGGA